MPKTEMIPSFDVLKKWGVAEMCQWLKKHNFQEAVPYFKEQNITGLKFVYLSEIQLFQMRNVSVKTKNGLKDAQKNVKGRPNGRGKDVIMNSDQPPKVPGKDYHHYTPDVDDDGWGSDFSENSDTQDGYIEPVTDDVYEDPDGADSCDSEYEEPTPRTDMPQTKKKILGAIPPNKRLPPEPKSPQQPIFPGTRKLPPEPPQDADGENYEIPDAAQDEPQDYEQPDGPFPPPQLQPRHPRLSPPTPKSVVAVPPRIPRRDVKPKVNPEPEKTTPVPTGPIEDYEKPAKPISAQRKVIPKSSEKQDDLDGLHSYTWYHGNMTRDKAVKGLLEKKQNGMFLVRKSTQTGSPYALSLFYERVYNLNIRLRPDNKYALGNAKKDEKAFGSVPVLISYFQNNTLLLGGNESTQTTLIQALPK